MQWREAVKVGMRKPLGLDFGKRRYWALGGRAACWRVYVEEAEGGSWGWYEGEHLCLPCSTCSGGLSMWKGYSSAVLLLGEEHIVPSLLVDVQPLRYAMQPCLQGASDQSR